MTSLYMYYALSFVLVENSVCYKPIFVLINVYIFVDMAHHFILLRFNPFDLRVDREGW